MIILKSVHIKGQSFRSGFLTKILLFTSLHLSIPALILMFFPLSIAKDLGLILNMDKPIIFGGVGEKSHKLTGYMAILDLMIFNKGENISFSTPIVFTNDIPSNGFSLLGESGFFDHLEQISFYYKRGKIVLEV